MVVNGMLTTIAPLEVPAAWIPAWEGISGISQEKKREGGDLRNLDHKEKEFLFKKRILKSNPWGIQTKLK